MSGPVCGATAGISYAITLLTCLSCQVKAKMRECLLHKENPLGETPLECYSCGSRNVFALGFVPVRNEESMVLVCRDHSANASGLKNLDIDLSLWEPLVRDRAFIPWLVKEPTEQVQLLPFAALSHDL